MNVLALLRYIHHSMESKNYQNFTAEDFVLDEDFQHWVMHPDEENGHSWSLFMEQYPGKLEEIRQAKMIVHAVQPSEPPLSEEVLNRIYSQITLVKKPVRKIRFVFWTAAASLLALITLGGLLHYYQDSTQLAAFETMSIKDTEKGKIVLADGTVREFDTENTTIQQTASGELKINNDTIVKHSTNVAKAQIAMNQIVIPFGKRSEITLADGTHIWLNSGSQISYPTTFSDKSREVYLLGEAFFDVKKDPSRPFTVFTKDVKLVVLGTRFNVSSFANDATTQAVLLSGKITAVKSKGFSSTYELLPGDRIVYNKDEENLSKDKVDVELYSSWINGYLIFRNEPVSGIFNKLERSYNKHIVVEIGLEKVTFSGKLDLIEDLDSVLENIAFTSSFKVSKENDIYTIKPPGQ